MGINDDILWKIDSEINKSKEVVNLKRQIERLEEENTNLRKALKCYEQGRYQEHLVIETIKGMFKDEDNHYEDGCDCKRIEEFLRIMGE